jgi:hypothetical protein
MLVFLSTTQQKNKRSEILTFPLLHSKIRIFLGARVRRFVCHFVPLYQNTHTHTLAVQSFRQSYSFAIDSAGKREKRIEQFDGNPWPPQNLARALEVAAQRRPPPPPRRM